MTGSYPRFALTVCLLLWASAVCAKVTVEIRGLGPQEEQNVKAHLALLSYANRIKNGTPSSGEIDRLNQRAPSEIRSALQPFGWYTPTISSSLKHEGNDWTAVYTVHAGPPTLVTKIEVRLTGAGAGQQKLLAATKNLKPLIVGGRLKQQDYSTVKQRLLQDANELGYLHARYSRHLLQVNPSRQSAEVLWTLNTGPRFYFGPITIVQQQKHLGEDVIRRYVTFSPGQPFSLAKVLSTRFALNDLGYFSTVQIEPQHKKVTADHRIPIVIQVTYAKPRIYRFGVGYGTDTGARMLAGIKWRRLNSRGQTLSLDLRPSQKISTAILDYRIPIGSVPGQAFDVTAQGLRQSFLGVNERLYSLGMARIQLAGLWQRRYYLTYTNDRYRIDGGENHYSALLTPGVNFSRTSVDNPIYPSRGWFAFLDIHGATRLDQISNVNFLSTHIKLRGIATVVTHLRLVARAEEGAVFSSQFSRLPPSQRFFAGGDDSVRGYAYNSLAPRDSAGNLVGGKYLTTGSLELDWDLWRPYGLAAFVDAGGADDVPNVRLHFGAGIGFRYIAPFGAISVDLAHPFDRNNPAVRLYLGVHVGL